MNLFSWTSSEYHESCKLYDVNILYSIKCHISGTNKCGLYAVNLLASINRFVLCFSSVLLCCKIVLKTEIYFYLHAAYVNSKNSKLNYSNSSFFSSCLTQNFITFNYFVVKLSFYLFWSLKWLKKEFLNQTSCCVF